MNRESFIKQATERLNEINVPYRVQDSADIAISGRKKMMTPLQYSMQPFSSSIRRIILFMHMKEQC